MMELGPNFCVIAGCSEEGFRCDIETSIVKEKWDRMSRDGDEEGEDHTTTEEEDEKNRLEQLAEETAAQARQAYDSETKRWSGAGLRVTDYKANTRVILPKALSHSEESKLEVIRMELQHNAMEWMKENCNCKGEQKSNLSKERLAGLKSLRERKKNGDRADRAQGQSEEGEW